MSLESSVSNFDIFMKLYPLHYLCSLHTNFHFPLKKSCWFYSHQITWLNYCLSYYSAIIIPFHTKFTHILFLIHSKKDTFIYFQKLIILIKVKNFYSRYVLNNLRYKDGSLLTYLSFFILFIILRFSLAFNLILNFIF